ncbi:hypothetical protein [Hoeflea sp.]|uniref:hypothetical protein n=1 Tax=Hoeflea sp. TaxID=1940281 RepID=UPI003BB02C0F
MTDKPYQGRKGGRYVRASHDDKPKPVSETDQSRAKSEGRKPAPETAAKPAKSKGN